QTPSGVDIRPTNAAACRRPSRLFTLSTSFGHTLVLLRSGNECFGRGLRRRLPTKVVGGFTRDELPDAAPGGEHRALLRGSRDDRSVRAGPEPCRREFQRAGARAA